MSMAGFIACRAVSRRNEDPAAASRPWDRDRDGFVMGEGAGILVLESLDHALARGAPILAEFLGGGIGCDAYHMTDPREDGAGIASCIQLALSNAQVGADDVDYVNAHATSTPAGDIAEVRAMKQVFARKDKLKMNATKSMIGHALGAASGIEAVATVMAIQTQKLHPTINLANPEPELEFDAVAHVACDHKVEVALSNSFGFGGHNSSVVFAKYR
jgi:3-oxoacyl-[acyl-carrier-protein] synthase II